MKTISTLLLCLFSLLQIYSQACTAGDETALLTCLANSESEIQFTSSFTVSSGVDLSGVTISFSNSQHDIIFNGMVTVDSGTSFDGSGNTSVTDDGMVAAAGGGGDIKFSELNALLATGNYTSLGNAIGNIVPVQWLYFTLNKQGNINILHWATASEINNDYFSVQASTDGKTFQEIGKVAGNGNSNKMIEYHFIDRSEKTAEGTYYRLKQIDYDGQYEYSRVNYAASNKGRETTLHYDFSSRSLMVELNKTNQIIIYDMAGRSVIDIAVDKNNEELTISAEHFLNGVYNVVVLSDTGKLTTTKVAVY